MENEHSLYNDLESILITRDQLKDAVESRTAAAH